MKQTVFYLSMLLLTISSCKKEEIPEPLPSPVPEPQVDTYISIKSIIDINCVGCHAPSQNAYLVDLTNYNSISNYLDNPNNTMIDRLNSDVEFYKMPPEGDLYQEDKDRLIDWINDGYLE
jgi:hypothetical protein